MKFINLMITSLLLWSAGFHLSMADTLVDPTHNLNGTDITYTYTSGRSYQVQFSSSGVQYRYLTGSKPDKWWGPYPYKAFEIEKNVFMASWFEEKLVDHVTLYINLERSTLYGSALLSGKHTHFYGANILKIVQK